MYVCEREDLTHCRMPEAEVVHAGLCADTRMRGAVCARAVLEGERDGCCIPEHEDGLQSV